MTLAPELSPPFTIGELPISATPTHSRRFTVDGSDHLERQLTHTRGEVRAAILHAFPIGRVEAILLGGGYGRGEGGVLKTKTGDRPYNDLEFYVALRGHRLLNERRHGPVLRELAHELTLLVGLEVEFKIISLAQLRAGPITMFSYDLIMGHRWVFGDDRLLAGCEHHRKAEHIPLAEATRLLMNRCSGLLFARDRLDRADFSEDDADFVGRNLAKVRLALGDAVLAALGRYHWSCRERHRRLRDLLLLGDLPAWLPALVALHDAGVEFKLHPQQSAASRAEFFADHQALTRHALDVWLWLESRRLARPFASARDYALARVNKCAGTFAWRNLAINLRTFGLRGIAGPRAFRYPRERLFHALAWLLWEPDVTRDPRIRQTLMRELRSDGFSPTQLAAAYHDLWRQFR